MNKYTLDCTGMTLPRQLHEALARTLAFPDWYGHNLDALYDCLTEIDQPTELRLEGWKGLGDWFQGFVLVFADIAQENPFFSVIL